MCFIFKIKKKITMRDSLKKKKLNILLYYQYEIVSLKLVLLSLRQCTVGSFLPFGQISDVFHHVNHCCQISRGGGGHIKTKTEREKNTLSN